ncbi:MAG: NTP transferase domain-containing protein, partial [Thermoanaerobaculia bacterium]|nr:NTP transferase domain-containing protein [Thermoanaerobaculia bacterium]
MGQDKGSLIFRGRSFLSIAVDSLRELGAIYRLGGAGIDGEAGEAGRGAGLPAVVPDVPGVPGPLAGMLAALRTHPDVAWVLVACDLPLVDVAA